MGLPGRLSVRPVQPAAALKRYECGGCGQTIPKGRYHLVVVPDEAPDLRRHWHRGCWNKERRRVGGRGALLGDPWVPLDPDAIVPDHDGDQIDPADS